MGAVTDFIARKYGVSATETRAKVVVLGAAAPVQILEPNPNRFAWVAFNLSAGTAYLGFDALVTATNGLQMNPAGGNFSVDAEYDLDLPTRQMYGIATAAVNLYVLETLVVP
jgi:hypothetical protein